MVFAEGARVRFGQFMLLFMAIACSGCTAQLNDQRTLTLEVGEIRTIVLAPVEREQIIKIAARSPDCPISVYVYLSENDEEVDRKITLGKPSDLILSSQTESEEIALEANIPANKEAMVRVASASPDKATVHLVITSP